jgi:hypothetical protein
MNYVIGVTVIALSVRLRVALALVKKTLMELYRWDLGMGNKKTSL